MRLAATRFNPRAPTFSSSRKTFVSGFSNSLTAAARLAPVTLLPAKQLFISHPARTRFLRFATTHDFRSIRSRASLM
jgi:hypothetical protein